MSINDLSSTDKINQFDLISFSNIDRRPPGIFDDSPVDFGNHMALVGAKRFDQFIQGDRSGDFFTAAVENKIHRVYRYWLMAEVF